MRVKRVRNPLYGIPANETFLPIGATGVVESVDEEYVNVIPDIMPIDALHQTPVWGCYPGTLEPIIDQDSKADEFIARLKKLGDEPKIPAAPKPIPVRTDA